MCLLSMIALAGCGAVEEARNAAKRQQMSNNLKQLGLAYHNCHDTLQRGPNGWQEAQEFGMDAKARQEIEDAGYTVHWGYKIQDIIEGTSNTVLAYPPNAATEGGQVLMFDASARQVSAAEFAELKMPPPAAGGNAAAGGDGGAADPFGAAPGGGAAPDGSGG
jgi:hypothetical protein